MGPLCGKLKSASLCPLLAQNSTTSSRPCCQAALTATMTTALHLGDAEYHLSAAATLIGLLQTDSAANYTGVSVPSNLFNPVTMHEGLIIKGNVFVNKHADPKRGTMSLGLDICYGTGLPCDKPTVSSMCHPSLLHNMSTVQGTPLSAQYRLRRVCLVFGADLAPIIQTQHGLLISVLRSVQVYDTNLINTPTVDITFADPETLMLTEASKAALSLAPYKPAEEVPFALWSTPVDTPAGRLSNEVPVDRSGVPRAAGNDLPGKLTWRLCMLHTLCMQEQRGAMCGYQ